MENNEKEVNNSESNTFGIGLTKALKYSLIWTIFFAIVGIIIQAINSKSFHFPSTIFNFFIKNFSDWVSSFGNFGKVAIYASRQDMYMALLDKWYYFFFAGGLLALIWDTLRWVLKLEMNFKIKAKPEASSEELKIVQQKARINQLIAEGMKCLVENQEKKAEEIYHKAKAEYNPGLDPSRESYSALVSFFKEVMKVRGN